MSFLTWRTVSADLSSFTELFLDLLRDLSLFFVSKLEESGTSGFHQDKLCLFQSERTPNNILNKFITLSCSTIIQFLLTIQEISLPRRLETLSLKDTTLLVLSVQNSWRSRTSIWEREIRRNPSESSALRHFWRCFRNWDHQKVKRDSRWKTSHSSFERWLVLITTDFIY